MIVTDAYSVADYASPDTIKTAPHIPNAATVPYAAAVTAENKTSVRQLIYGQEYPVAKDDNIKNGFDSKSAVEQ